MKLLKDVEVQSVFGGVDATLEVVHTGKMIDVSAGDGVLTGFSKALPRIFAAQGPELIPGVNITLG